MDRMISLLAALVGLIALLGAILVHTYGDAERHRMATEMAQLKASVALLGAPPPSGTHTSGTAAHADDGTAEALLALQTRINGLEQQLKEQQSRIETAQILAETAPTSAPPPLVADVSGAMAPPVSDEPATKVAAVDGPTSECIPQGTRFVASAGDSFPICKSKVVVKVPDVSDGIASIGGAGDVGVGETVALDKSCKITVLSAALGYAELRVGCT